MTTRKAKKETEKEENKGKEKGKEKNTKTKGIPLTSPQGIPQKRRDTQTRLNEGEEEVPQR